MDDSQNPAPHRAEKTGEHLASFLAEQRRKMSGLLAHQREKLGLLGSRIGRDFEELERTVRTELDHDLAAERRALDERRELLATEEQEFAAAQTATAGQLEEWSAELDLREKTLIERETAFAATLEDVERERIRIQSHRSDIEEWRADTQAQRDRLARRFSERHADLAAAREESAIEQARLRAEAETLRAELIARRADLEQEYALVEGIRQATLDQRRKIAECLWAKRRAALEELEILRLEALRAATTSEMSTADNSRSAVEAERMRIQSEELQDRLEAAVLERNVLRTRVAELESGVSDQGAENADLTTLRETCARLTTECDELRSSLRDVDLSRADTAAQVARVSQLEAERDALRTKTLAAESRARAAEEKLTQQAALGEHPEKISELHKRYEIAMDDVRGLKRRNSELENQLAGARKSGGNEPAAPAGGWEDMKRRMLEQLESQDGGLEQDDRRKLENTLRETDRIVEHKDQEIADLRQLLQEQSNQVGDLAVGAAAVAQIFDHDELIQQERDRLRFAQDEWREKLRQAEIDIALERAKLARERMEMQEKIHQFEHQSNAETQMPPGKETDRRPGRGRWLSRLGLKDKE